MKKNIAVVILAAGKSTRMKSQTPKVLHPICARPLLGYVTDMVKSLKATKVVAVLGYKQEEVRKILPTGIKVVLQKKLIGTADALKTALPALRNFNGTVLVLYGDNPLLKKETIAQLLKTHDEMNADATLLTAQVEKPASYGRILRDEFSSICGIVEEKDADDFQKDIKEINTGIVCFKSKSLVKYIRQIRPNNKKKEYYLTDIIGILYNKGCLVEAARLQDINEALGINSRGELSKANKIMQRRIHDSLMKEGVSIVDPETTFISFGTKIGPDTTIYPFTVIERNVTIGDRCSIGPFAHLREGTVLKDDVLLGNFLETVRTTIGSKTLVKHFSYLGDTSVGKHANIGAGTVTANFDGVNKNNTVIKDHAFIGSDTVLVAPVKIGRGAKTGAGCVVPSRKDVRDNTVVVGVPARPLNHKTR